MVASLFLDVLLPVDAKAIVYAHCRSGVLDGIVFSGLDFFAENGLTQSSQTRRSTVGYETRQRLVSGSVSDVHGGVFDVQHRQIVVNSMTDENLALQHGDYFFLHLLKLFAVLNVSWTNSTHTGAIVSDCFAGLNELVHHHLAVLFDNRNSGQHVVIAERACSDHFAIHGDNFKVFSLATTFRLICSG